MRVTRSGRARGTGVSAHFPGRLGRKAGLRMWLPVTWFPSRCSVLCGTWRRWGRCVQEPWFPRGTLRSLSPHSTSQGAHLGHSPWGLPELVAPSPFRPDRGHTRWGTCASSGGRDGTVLTLGSDCRAQFQLLSSSVLSSGGGTGTCRRDLPHPLWRSPRSTTKVSAPHALLLCWTAGPRGRHGEGKHV